MTQASSSRQEQIIAEYEGLWNGEFSNIDVVAESASVYDPAAPEGVVHGRDAVEAHVRETFQGFPDFELETHDILVRDDIVMLDWTASGTFDGEFYGAPPTGRSFTVSGMAKTIVRDGKVREDRLYYNEKDMLAQLGVTFPDVLPLLPKMIRAKLRGLW
ncbi:ester cyclase [Salinigranum salinum]|uniref:ester cyclase n=1 Tax=Salinigranum salinum TaxID=1364937 RepID=UPI00126079FD|nr:ester cyclase [Salinigranum salinum]